MPKKIRALIVDDEEPARQDLRRELSKQSLVEVIGEASSVKSAAAIIPELKPDVVFLDIQMPGESGFKLFDRLDVTFNVVFVTAFDNYAIRAFEVNALDYLLKPVCPDRLAQTIARLSGQSAEHKISKKQLKYNDQVFIKSEGRIGFLKVNSITCITATGDYTEFYTTKGEKRLMHKPLRQWLEELPEQYFVRINRATIINMEYVEKVEPTSRSTYQVHIKDISEPFVTSRNCAKELRERFLGIAR
jgi:two-component system, LytTR family, response regulator